MFIILELNIQKCAEQYIITVTRIMGGTSLKKVEQSLERRYKPVRKYYDSFYGETTIIMQQQSQKKYCKIQKILFPNKHISDYINTRRSTEHQILIAIKQLYKVPIDLCSGNEMYVFVLEYENCTLYQEIMKRCNEDHYWDIKQVICIMHKMINIVKVLSKVQARKILFSNSSFIYFGDGKIKGIQSILCNKIDTSQFDFPMIATDNQQNRQYYISPQSFEILCRREKQRSKQVALQQSSIIFTLGMNFLQLILLADLSELYNKEKKQFDYVRLKQAEQNIEQTYGDGLQKLISSMLELEPQKRSSFADIEDYLKYMGKCYGVQLHDHQQILGDLRV